MKAWSNTKKYQFQPVYETQSGGWAGCGDPYDWEFDDMRRDPRIVPRALSLRDPPRFSIAGLSEAEVREHYPEAYYARDADEVVCTAGVTPDELFQIKRAGVLRNRKVFD